MHFDAVERNLSFKHNHKLTLERKMGDGEPGLSNQAPTAAKPYQRARRFSRHRLDVRIQASVFRDGLTITYWGRTSELGQDGMGATLSGELRTGEVVSLEFPIPLQPRVMKVRAAVRYSDGLRCGFEFLIVSSEQREALHQLCDLLTSTS